METKTSPTFYHTTVLLHEAVAGLAIKPEGIYADATFGGGGHSRLILQQLGPQGRLIAFDHDADAWRNKPDDNRLITVTENFRHLSRFLRLHGHQQIDGILADLGVSSWQFDTAGRGFSTRFDGPLDMRMDNRSDRTAAHILATFTEPQLHQLFEKYGEVRNSRELARHIAAHRSGKGPATIAEFIALITPVIKGNPARYLAQVFQALRIEVNEELEALKEFLSAAAQCLKPGGRLSVISFHSLEDRLVKTFLKRGTWQPEDTVSFLPEKQEPLFKILTAKPVEASETEQINNPRSRSAKLRIAQRL